MLPKHNRSQPQTNARSNSKSSKFAFGHSFVQSAHRILREGSSCKIKMRVSLQRRAIQNFKTRVSLQRRAQKCMNPAHDVSDNPRHTKITISTTVSDVRPARSDERVARATSKFAFHHSFTSDEHETTKWLRDDTENFAFHHCFGRPTSTK